jgi:hypothetical protein
MREIRWGEWAKLAPASPTRTVAHKRLVGEIVRVGQAEQAYGEETAVSPPAPPLQRLDGINGFALAH